MTEQPFMNIQTWQLAATNGEAAIFMHSRGEVCSFLQSSAYYWMNEFHFDGLRMDAVGNLIYWQGDASRGENLAALKFIRTMNQA